MGDPGGGCRCCQTRALCTVAFLGPTPEEEGANTMALYWAQLRHKKEDCP